MSDPKDTGSRDEQARGVPGGSESFAPGALDPNKQSPQDESTTFFLLPQFQGKALLPETGGKLLEALKAQLSGLEVDEAGSGIRHQDGKYAMLPKTLRSAWMAKVKHPVLGEVRFLVGQTRSIWVMVYGEPPEKLYEDPRFMSIELKQRDVTHTPRGKRMYVSRIEKSDLDQLNAIAAVDARGTAAPDTLAPTAGTFSLEVTLARLRKCTLVESTDPSFALEDFFDSIHFMTPTQGPTGNYYYLDTHSEQGVRACELHVGVDPSLPDESYQHKATLSYRGEPCALFIGVEQ